MARAIDAPQASAGRPGGQGDRALHGLMISDVYFFRINGVSTSIETFRRTLVKTGHHVTVMAPRCGGDEQRCDWLIRIASRGVPVHLFVFASRTETQGLVLLEAMALGVPVVSTAVAGARDIVGPEQGAVVAREDVEDFAAKVGSLLRDPARRRRLGEQGRRFARTWPPGTMAQRLLRFYGEIARRAKRRRLAGPEPQIGRPAMMLVSQPWL